jgi:hypothetical protein
MCRFLDVVGMAADTAGACRSQGLWAHASLCMRFAETSIETVIRQHGVRRLRESTGKKHRSVDSRGMLALHESADGDEDRTSGIRPESGFRSNCISHAAHAAIGSCVTGRRCMLRSFHESGRREHRACDAPEANARKACSAILASRSKASIIAHEKS